MVVRAARQHLDDEEASVTLSTFLLSFLTGSPSPADGLGIGDAAPASRTQGPTTAVPPSVLCNRVRARWTRPHRIGVEVRGADELAAATRAMIPSHRLVVHADALCAADLVAACELSVGHIVVESARHVVPLDSAVVRRQQSVLLRSTHAASASRADRHSLDEVAAAQLVAHPLLVLAGLHADIGARRGAFVSVPAAVGQMIAEMTDIRDRHDVTLSRLSLSIDRATAAGPVDLSRYVDAAVRDACYTSGFPLPSVILSAAVVLTGRRAA